MTTKFKNSQILKLFRYFGQGILKALTESVKMTQKYSYKSQIVLFYFQECDEKAEIMIKDNTGLYDHNKKSYFVVFEVVVCLFMVGPPEIPRPRSPDPDTKAQ